MSIRLLQGKSLAQSSARTDSAVHVDGAGQWVTPDSAPDMPALRSLLQSVGPHHLSRLSEQDLLFILNEVSTKMILG